MAGQEWGWQDRDGDGFTWTGRKALDMTGKGGEGHGTSYIDITGDGMESTEWNGTTQFCQNYLACM